MEKINFIHIPKNGGTSIKEICNQLTKPKLALKS